VNSDTTQLSMETFSGNEQLTSTPRSSIVSGAAEMPRSYSRPFTFCIPQQVCYLPKWQVAPPQQVSYISQHRQVISPSRFKPSPAGLLPSHAGSLLFPQQVWHISSRSAIPAAGHAAMRPVSCLSQSSLGLYCRRRSRPLALRQSLNRRCACVCNCRAAHPAYRLLQRHLTDVPVLVTRPWHSWEGCTQCAQ
jgi:hypothetical protein